MSRHQVSARVHGPLSRLAWFLWYFAVLLIPLFLTWHVIAPSDTTPGGAVTLSAGLVGFSAVVVAVVLPARLPWLIASFGIETVLAVHRLIALIAVVLVLVHLVAVLIVDPRGLSILDLAHTTWAARAAVTSTFALVLVVVLALRRPGRQPRYEGWRLVHNGLVAIVVIAAWLHVWWLRHLVSDVLVGQWVRRWRSRVVRTVAPGVVARACSSSSQSRWARRGEVVRVGSRSGERGPGGRRWPTKRSGTGLSRSRETSRPRDSSGTESVPGAMV